MAKELTRYQSTETYDAPQISMGQARVYETLSQRLQSFADRQARQADIQAQREGALAGAEAAAGKIGGTQMMDENTIRGAAFNKAARAGHAAAIQNDIRENTARLETQFATDIEGFNASMTKYKEGLVSEVDPSMRMYVETDLDQYQGASQTRIANNAFKLQQQETLAEVTRAAQGLQDDAQRYWREGDLDRASMAGSKLEFMLDQAVQEGLMEPVAVEKLKMAYQEESDTNYVLGDFERILQNQGLEAAQKAYDNYAKADNPDLSVSANDTLKSKMRALVSAERVKQTRQLALDKAKKTARETAIKDEVDVATEAMDQGRTISNFDEILERAKGTKYEKDLLRANALAKAGQEFAAGSMQQQEATLNRLRNKKEITTGEQRALERFEKIYKREQTQLKEDPFALAMEQGIAQPTPIDYSNLESLQARGLEAQQASAHYGMKINPLTKQEAAQLATILQEGNTDQKMLIMQNMVDGFGTYAVDAMREVAKQGGGIYAAAGDQMGQGQPQVARAMLQGMRQIEMNKDILPKELRTDIGTGLQGIFANFPKQQALVIDSVEALYAQRMAMKGKLVNKDDAVDSDILEESINQVTGGILEVEFQGQGMLWDDNYYIQAPAPGMTSDDFDDWTGSIKAGDIDAMGGVMGLTSQDVAEMVNDQTVKFITIDQGVYYLETRSGNVIQDANGKPFEFRHGVISIGK